MTRILNRERINDEFEAVEVATYVLFRNGQPIVDSGGRVRHYKSRERATEIAENWDRYHISSYTELRGMSDEELHAKIEEMR